MVGHRFSLEDCMQAALVTALRYDGMVYDGMVGITVIQLAERLDLLSYRLFCIIKIAT